MTQSPELGQNSAASGNSPIPQRTRLIMIALPLINGVLLALGLLGVFFSSGGDWNLRFDGMHFLPWMGVALLVGLVSGLGYSVAAATWKGRKGCAIAALLIGGIVGLLFFIGASLLIVSTFWY